MSHRLPAAARPSSAPSRRRTRHWHDRESGSGPTLRRSVRATRSRVEEAISPPGVCVPVVGPTR
jgi:hypothetical protein